MGYDSCECLSCYASLGCNNLTDRAGFVCFKCLPVSESYRVTSYIEHLKVKRSVCAVCHEKSYGYVITLCEDCGGKEMDLTDENYSEDFWCLSCIASNSVGIYFIGQNETTHDIYVNVCHECQNSTYGYDIHTG